MKRVVQWGLGATILLVPFLVHAEDPAAVTTNAEAVTNAESSAVSPSSSTNQVVESGKTVRFDYSLLVEGKEVENSSGVEPVQFVHGQGDIVPGLEKELAGMKVGEEKTINVKMEEGYGPIDPQAIQEVPRELIPSDIDLQPGTLLQMNDDQGNVFPATVVEVKQDKVKLDFNHPLAGKDLTFKVKIVDIK